MTVVWLRAALWLGLALAATLISIRLRVATALSEIVVGTVVAAPMTVGGLLLAKLLTKTCGLWPITRVFRYPRTEAAYATLLMSTGLTFGSISALFGLTHHVIDQAQYSYVIATVIGSAVVPTLIANALFVPRYLLPKLEAPTSSGPLPTAVAVGQREG